MPPMLRPLAALAAASCFLVVHPIRVTAQGGSLITCESSGTLTVCPVAAAWRGARLVRQISKTPCLEQQTWGFDRRGIWVDKGCRGSFDAGDRVASAGERVTCASAAGKRVECPADIRYGVRLVRQVSDSPCRENTSWGTTLRAIWVDAGCRGEFEIGAAQPQPPVPPAGAAQRITCGALTQAPVQCNISGRAAGVRLVRDLTNGRCRQGVSWGYTAALIWTNKGCRGEFEATFATIKPPAPGSRIVTCGTTSGQYLACPANGAIREVRLMRDVSGAGRCAAPQNWGHSNVEIWTRNGCRGDFQVFYQAGGPTGPTPPAPPSVRVVACGLVTGQRVQCKTGGVATAVRLQSDFSGGRCRQGSTWGFTESYIWTSTSCRGQFEVTYRTTPGLN